MTGKPRVALFDVDGTLMLNTGGRKFWEWDRVGEDTPNAPVVELARNIILAGLLDIVVMSGRSRVCYDATSKSLADQQVFFRGLIMRRAGDYRPDEVTKFDLYQEHVAPHYDVAFVVDDRQKVVRMWRELGLTVFQCAEGNH